MVTGGATVNRAIKPFVIGVRSNLGSGYFYVDVEVQTRRECDEGEGRAL